MGAVAIRSAHDISHHHNVTQLLTNNLLADRLPVHESALGEPLVQPEPAAAAALAASAEPSTTSLASSFPATLASAHRGAYSLTHKVTHPVPPLQLALTAVAAASSTAAASAQPTEPAAAAAALSSAESTEPAAAAAAVP